MTEKEKMRCKRCDKYIHADNYHELAIAFRGHINKHVIEDSKDGNIK